MATKVIVFNGFSRNDMRNVKVGRGGLVSSIPKEGDYIQLTWGVTATIEVFR